MVNSAFLRKIEEFGVPHNYRHNIDLLVHGLPVHVLSSVESITGQIDSQLLTFAAGEVIGGSRPTMGIIGPYNEEEILSRLSPAALRFPVGQELVELYQQDERFWLVDEQAGLIEIDLLKGHWQSWVLDRPSVDPNYVFERCVLWPLSQVLRSQGLSLVPAISVVRDGFGVLLVAPFSLESELRVLVQAGYRIISQRWTAVRDQAGQLELLQSSGATERAYSPIGRKTTTLGLSRWVDLCEELNCQESRASCNAVIIADPGRRGTAHMHQLASLPAADALRAYWPIADLRPNGRGPELALKLANRSHCCQIQLSRNPADLLVLLEAVRTSSTTVTQRQMGPARRLARRQARSLEVSQAA